MGALKQVWSEEYGWVELSADEIPAYQDWFWWKRFMIDEYGRIWLILPADPDDWTLEDLIVARMMGYFDDKEDNGGDNCSPAEQKTAKSTNGGPLLQRFRRKI